MSRLRNLNPFSLSLIVLALLLVQSFWLSSSNVASLSYRDFQAALKEDRVKDLVVSDQQIRGRLVDPIDGKEYFVTNRVDPDLARELQTSAADFRAEAPRGWLANLVGWLLPLAILLAFWLFLFRRAGAGGPAAGLMAIGKSRAKVYAEEAPSVTFADVAGVDEAKDELREIVAFLSDPADYGRLGARMPKGILLVGPPGTGKTLLARAVAGEARVPFFSISGSEFVEMFVGVGAARVRDLFEQARKQAPCIIFVDELDALGRARGVRGVTGGHDEKEQTLNQLLVELDGFDPSSGIVILAATNRPEILDPALLRAGRFDRQVLVDRPDKAGRAAILSVHIRRVLLADDVRAERVAGLTAGFTGADLANLVNEAALVATRERAERVGMRHFTAAIERIVAGLEKKNRLLSPREREIVAHHEMGHAIVASSLPGTDAVHKVSIIPRGIGALGYTMQRPTEDRFLMTREELENKLAVLLGGRAAEHLVYGHLSTGASDDLARATDIGRSMVTRYAMVPELGNAAFERESSSLLSPDEVSRTPYSEETAREIDRATRSLVDRAFNRARAILDHNRRVMYDGAQELLERETLDEADLEKLFARLSLPPGECEDAAA
jgi:cell division protease FtsH